MDNNVKSAELLELKKKLSESGFSEAVIAKLDALLEKSIASGSMSEVDKTLMKELMDIDVEAVKAKAKSMEGVAALIVEELSETPAAPVSEPVAPVTMEPAPVVYPWSQPAEPVAPVATEPAPSSVASQWNLPVTETPVVPFSTPLAPAAPVAPVATEPAPVATPWNQTVTETTTSSTQPAPFPGSSSGKI